jgi:hypothetical protein
MMGTLESTGAKTGSGRNRLWLILGGVLLACCCVAAIGAVLAGPAIMKIINSAAEGGSLYSGRADALLKQDTLNLIGTYESAQYDCTDVSLFIGQVLLAPEQTGDGSWSEMWQVNACGASHLYSVTFTPSADGGTDISVSPAEQ